MKKIFAVLLLFTIVVISSKAQFTKIGSALSYNSGYFFNSEYFNDHRTGNPVLSFTGIYEISLPFHIKPSVNIFFPHITKIDFSADEFQKTVVTAYTLDLDAHYVFNYLDRFELYGLAGMNIMYARVKWIYEFIDLTDVSSSGETVLGLNLGIGTYIKVRDQFDLFFELKGIIGSQQLIVATGGILLDIDWLKRKEESEF